MRRGIRFYWRAGPGHRHCENKKKSIFVRFENLVDRNLFNPSTGIGLSLVKELVEMHKALIT